MLHKYTTAVGLYSLPSSPTKLLLSAGVPSRPARNTGADTEKKTETRADNNNSSLIIWINAVIYHVHKMQPF